MSREQNVPLLLWISTAILAHIATGGGADTISRIFEERSELQSFARGVRARLQPDPTLEITFSSEPSSEESAQRDPPPLAKSPPKAPAEPLKKPESEPLPQAVKKAEKKPEKEQKKDPVILPAMQQAPPAAPDRRIAVRQHAQPDQQDNPEAKFIADQANHAAEETAARITSHDQDDPTPTPGGQHQGSDPTPGTSEQTRVGESDEHRGDPTHAPGESSSTPVVDRSARASGNQTAKTNEPAQRVAPNAAPSLRAGDPTPAAHAARAAEPSTPPPNPDPVAHAAGEYALDPYRNGADGKRQALPPTPASTARTGSSRVSMLGLGGAATPSGINLNLSQSGVVAAVGEDQLNRERLADGERRRSEHRGSWRASGFERWRPAIENYVASVKPGNQTALNTAQVPFASYLNAIHNRIHPLFADDFLSSLSGLPPNHPMNEPNLLTRLEIVLGRDDGRVVKMGIVRTSGITAFDIAALDAVQRASPFGKPPESIVSADGNVYFHWEFHRDPIYACSTMNARPFMLNVPPPAEAPPKAPPSRPAPFPTDPREQGPSPSTGSRQGSLDHHLGGASPSLTDDRERRIRASATQLPAKRAPL